MSELTQILPSPAIQSKVYTTVLKWVASVFQIFGYAATAFGMTPLNIYLFFGGLIGWFIVGVLWQDRAIMLIHVVALAAMIAGLLGTSG